MDQCWPVRLDSTRLDSATNRSHNAMTIIESVQETLEMRQGGQDNEDVKDLV